MDRPSMDAWLAEAKRDPASPLCGMYLFHNGVVRSTPKSTVRGGLPCDRAVRAVRFSFDRKKAEAAIERAKRLLGIHCVRVWLNEGELAVGDDLMLVLVGGDIRPHVVDALQSLVGELKSDCVTEQELYE